MKRYISFMLGILIISMLGFMTYKNEQLLDNGLTVYVKLQPVDPRSMIQGDYMALSYDIPLKKEIVPRPEQRTSFWALFSITLDEQGCLESAHLLDDEKKLAPNEYLLKAKVDFNRWSSRSWRWSNGDIYPSSDSFLFAEGLGSCYEKAKYALLKVDNEGNTLLKDLVGENLEDLHCKASVFK